MSSQTPDHSKSSVTRLIKYAKAMLVCAVALYFSLLAFNNITSYNINYTFISHVLSMDTTFPDNGSMWRSINSSTLTHIFYVFIILVEAVIAIFCWIGGYRLFKAVRSTVSFNNAKSEAIIGLTIGLLLWLVGFLAIAGEWFLMWQSQDWNVQRAAFHMFIVLGIILLFLVQPDEGSK